MIYILCAHANRVEFTGYINSDSACDIGKWKSILGYAFNLCLEVFFWNQRNNKWLFHQ